MKLNTEFYASTKLRDWYPIVKDNFNIIQAKTNELEVKVDNAMTKRDVNMYFNQVLASAGVSINAIEELAEAIKNSDQNVAEALRNLSEKRLRASVVSAENCPNTSIDAELGEENTIVFFEATVPESPADGAVTVLHMPAGDYLFSSDTIYIRTHNGTWRDIHSEIQSEINAVNDKLKEQAGCVFGAYVGNDEESRVINLGFTPIAVEIYGDRGFQSALNHNVDGGFAMRGFPCKYHGDLNAIEIVEGGFKVFHMFDALAVTGSCNTNSGTHYFKAYKSDNEILAFGKED